MACHLKIYTWKYFWTREHITVQVTLLFIYAFFPYCQATEIAAKRFRFLRELGNVAVQGK